MGKEQDPRCTSNKGTSWRQQCWDDWGGKATQGVTISYGTALEAQAYEH